MQIIDVLRDSAAAVSCLFKRFCIWFVKLLCARFAKYSSRRWSLHQQLTVGYTDKPVTGYQSISYDIRMLILGNPISWNPHWNTLNASRFELHVLFFSIKSSIKSSSLNDSTQSLHWTQRLRMSFELQSFIHDLWPICLKGKLRKNKFWKWLNLGIELLKIRRYSTKLFPWLATTGRG